MYYRPISDWVKQIYRDPVKAELCGSWQQRAQQVFVQDVVSDISGSKLVADAMQEDPEFFNDPRNLVVMLITDDFIVSDLGTSTNGCDACVRLHAGKHLAHRLRLPWSPGPH